MLNIFLFSYTQSESRPVLSDSSQPHGLPLVLHSLHCLHYAVKRNMRTCLPKSLWYSHDTSMIVFPWPNEHPRIDDLQCLCLILRPLSRTHVPMQAVGITFRSAILIYVSLKPFLFIFLLDYAYIYKYFLELLYFIIVLLKHSPAIQDTLCYILLRPVFSSNSTKLHLHY